MPKHLFTEYHRPVDYRDTWRIFRLMSEFVEGYQFLSDLKREVTIFGSARNLSASREYQEAEKLGRLLAKNKNTVITGGGPGIMEAANKGAFEMGGESIALSIQLPEEQKINRYVKKNLNFFYFVTRKVMLTSPSQAYVFFPGGYGTMDELFEVLNYIELGAIERVPIILVGKNFWEPLADFLTKCSCGKIASIQKNDLSLFTIVETAEEAMAIIKKTREKVFLSDLDPRNILRAQTEKTDWRIFRIMAELVEGFEFLSDYVKNAVTFLGSKSLARGSLYYEATYKLAKELGLRKYAIITGGGSGVMEAANKGAFETGAESVGLSITLDGRFHLNQYVTKSLSFAFPFIRKLILTAPSQGMIFFPGGFGTLHQFFEILTLLKTHKAEESPILLYDREFWKPLVDFIQKSMAAKHKTISPHEYNLFAMVDDVKEALRLLI